MPIAVHKSMYLGFFLSLVFRSLIMMHLNLNFYSSLNILTHKTCLICLLYLHSNSVDVLNASYTLPSAFPSALLGGLGWSNQDVQTLPTTGRLCGGKRPLVADLGLTASCSTFPLCIFAKFNLPEAHFSLLKMACSSPTCADIEHPHDIPAVFVCTRARLSRVWLLELHEL